MSDKENGSDSSGQKPTVPKGMKMTLMTAALLATIKIVIPVMALFSLGLMVDVLQHHVAFWAIIGTVLGFVVAALLIYLQTRYTRNENYYSFLYALYAIRKGRKGAFPFLREQFSAKQKPEA